MAASTKTNVALGKVLADKYQVTREIGRGGMATVHEAENIKIGKRVAIKILSQDLTGSKIVVERFLREARAAAAIRSPYICDVYDSGELPETGQPYLVLELLEGESLYERMTRQRQLDVNTTLTVVIQVCRGLTKAHAANIVHRDLKPENIFLTKDEDGQLLAKILDFGLAKFYTPTKEQVRLTRDGAVFGTPAYMSPEQVRGQGAVDHRADLWALGCITYECFTGKTVWSTDQGVAMTFAQIANSPLPRPNRYRPDLPPELTEWFDKALDRQIERRFQTARELSEQLVAAFGMAVGPNGPVSRESSEIRSAPRSDDAPPSRAPAPASIPAPASARNGAAMNAPVSQRPGRAAWGQAPAPGAPAPGHDRPGLELDDDPTRVLSRSRTSVEPPQPRVAAPAGHVANPKQRVGAEGIHDGKMETFRRDADGRIAKVVPQVAPPPPPAPPAPPPPRAAPPMARPVAMAPRPAPMPEPHRAPMVQPPAPSMEDTGPEKNPFARPSRTKMMVLVGLCLLVSVGAIFALTWSPSGTPNGETGPVQTATATVLMTATNVAPTAETPRPAPLPAWVEAMRGAQEKLADGDAKTAVAKFREVAAASKHSAPKTMGEQIDLAPSRGACSLAAIGRPRTYDIEDPAAKRLPGLRPSIVAVPGGALALFIDAHKGAPHAFVTRLTEKLIWQNPSIDVTPDAGEVTRAELFSSGDRVGMLFVDAKNGTFAAWLDTEGRPIGKPVQVTDIRDGTRAPVIAVDAKKGAFVLWSGPGDKDSEDLFFRKLAVSSLAPEGDAIRATDLVPQGAPRAVAVRPRAALTSKSADIVFRLERDPMRLVTLLHAPLDKMSAGLPPPRGKDSRAVGALSTVNIDRGKADAPNIACVGDTCYVAWHGESPPGVGVALYDAAIDRFSWRKRPASKGVYPVVASSGVGAQIAWIEGGRVVTGALTKAGLGRTARLVRAAREEPMLWLVPGNERGSWLMAWLDVEASVSEPFVARLRCP